MRLVIVLLFATLLPAQPLRSIAAIRLGAAVNPTYFGEAAYANTLATEFSQVEPENAMKFGPIEPNPGSFNWNQPDQIVAFAQAHHMFVRGHTMVWHQQNPTWLNSLAPGDLSTALHNHIQTVLSRYAGKVYAWDVVNEAFNDNGTLRSTLWSDSPGIGLSGTAYIEQAFRWAHDADPQALLFYNDYGAEAVNTKSDAIYKMAQDFVARGVPLHGIGMQMHLTASGINKASVAANIKRLTDVGLQVQITELDVRLPVDSTGAASSDNLAKQAQIYADVFNVCLQFARCTAVQTWGFTDKYSWIPGTFSGFGAGLPFDASYNPKPAYNAIAGALQAAPLTIVSGALTNAASYANAAVAPREIVVLFGAAFGPPALATDAASLADVRLYFDGDPAPLVYAVAGQVAAEVPPGVAGKSTTSVQYEYLGVRSNAINVPVQAAAPGLFTLDGSGGGPGAILDANYDVVSRSNPARHGGYIVLYGTGGGASPAGARVTIGGVDCPVAYAGDAPGLVDGALQVNVQIPAGVPSGDRPVVLTISGASSQAGVTVAVE